MARLVHPSGDLEINITGITSKDKMLVVKGTLGVWDADIYMTPREIAKLMRLLFNWSVVGYLVRLPLLLIRGSNHEDNA